MSQRSIVLTHACADADSHTKGTLAPKRLKTVRVNTFDSDAKRSIHSLLHLSARGATAARRAALVSSSHLAVERIKFAF